jgi:hypothetical protein
VCAALWGWFGARWYLANVISEVVTTGDTPNIDLARMATRWGPADPFTHWRLGRGCPNRLYGDQHQETVRDFAFAVQLSPNDFRYWDEYGRALEMSGDQAAAEKALRRQLIWPRIITTRVGTSETCLCAKVSLAKRSRISFERVMRTKTVAASIQYAWQAYDQNSIALLMMLQRIVGARDVHCLFSRA